MKKIYLSIVLAAITFMPGYAQTWTQKANFAGANRNYDCGFSIGHYGYIGCGWNGSSYYKDFYKWNQTTNTWSAIASYPGNGSLTPIGFSIEGKGYVGLGSSSSARNTDLWRYDTASNTWTQMTSLPGSARYDESVFVLGHKAWVVTGSTGGPPYLQDVWMYDAHQNTWTQMANFPGGHLSGVMVFTIGNHGYAGGGWDASVEHNQFWQYDTTNDTWTAIPNIPFTNGISAGDAKAFVLGNKAYICVGTTNITHTLPVGYYYDALTNTWIQFTNMGAYGLERNKAVTLTIGNYGYIGTGIDSTNTYLNSFWQYTDSNFLGTNEVVDAFPSGKVIMYPNPVVNNVTFVYSGLANGQNKLELFDITGREVKATYLGGREGKALVNVNDLSNGTYFYRVAGSAGQAFNGKFIIEK